MKINEQLEEMLTMQDRMNSVVNPDWREANYPWYRAIWVECAELMDHYGWKWWKQQEPDMQQVKLELVDIWHFILSDRIQYWANDKLLILELRQLIGGPSSAKTFNGNFCGGVETFAHYTLKDKQPSVLRFLWLCNRVGMTFDELYRLYIGKNALNIFRQENGYKEGTYQKIWRGKEDNEVLMVIIGSIRPGAENFYQCVYSELQHFYPGAES